MSRGKGLNNMNIVLVNTILSTSCFLNGCSNSITLAHIVYSLFSTSHMHEL